MKQTFSILMIIVLMLPNLTKIGILIDFKINQDFIAEVLCINKEQPIAVCYGQCYLSDRLKEAGDQEEKQLPGSKKTHSEINYYYANDAPGLSHAVSDYASKLNPVCDDVILLSSFVSDIFRPPKPHLI